MVANTILTDCQHNLTQHVIGLNSFLFKPQYKSNPPQSLSWGNPVGSPSSSFSSDMIVLYTSPYSTLFSSTQTLLGPGKVSQLLLAPLTDADQQGRQSVQSMAYKNKEVILCAITLFYRSLLSNVFIGVNLVHDYNIS